MTEHWRGLTTQAEPIRFAPSSHNEAFGDILAGVSLDQTL